jgi:hypothetical protein
MTSYPEMEPAVYILPRIMSGVLGDRGSERRPKRQAEYLSPKVMGTVKKHNRNCVLDAIQCLEAFDR